MLTADSALIGTHQPALEERGDSMHPREHRVGGLAAPEENSSVMAIAELGEETVALQPVGDHDGTRLNPTDEGFVHLDRAGQTVPAKPDHRTSKLVQPRPCGSIAAQAEDSLQSRRAGAVLLTTIHQTARNQVTNDVRVSWKIVPAVTDVWCPQLPHIQSPRPVHHAWVPSQVGHTNPWGHRSRAR